MRRLVLVLVVLMATVLAASGLSGCGGDDAAKAEPKPLRSCELEGTGFVFRTRLGTCRAAIKKGIELSVDAGFVSDPEVVGAGAAFAALCDVLQGDEKVVYDDESGRELARALHRTGVCPGKMANLATAP